MAQPRNIRNFWINADMDGRETPVVGGPVGKDGGMAVEIRQRDEGVVSIALRVYCDVIDGRLVMQVWDERGNLILERTTER